jgi:hypothetical protein
VEKNPWCVFVQDLGIVIKESFTMQVKGVVEQVEGQQWTPSEASHVELELKKRALKDPEFRALALKNPEAAIAKINSKALPKGFKIKIVENEGANVVIVLPDPVGRVQALSEFDLETIAGGILERHNNNITV